MIRKHASTPPYPARTAVALLTLSLAFLSGCHKKSSGIDPASLGPTNSADGMSNLPAPTASFAADPLAIDLGQSVVLNWRTSNATSVTIDGIGQVNTSGTQTVSPANSTNFHLTAKGDGGTTEANVRVTVRVPTVPQGGTTSGLGAGQGLGGGSRSGMPSDSEFHAAVQDAFFDYDSFDLRPDAQTAATRAAGYLVQHPNVRVLIGGYCDERGSAEYNLALAENRANSARTALVQAGVAASRVRVVSYGKEKQFCTEANESCWQENRRAQFTIDR